MATYSLTAQYQLLVNFLFQQTLAQNSQPDVLVPGSTTFPTIGDTFTYGTGSIQATNLWHDSRTVGGGANDDLILNGGSITNAFGVLLALTNIKFFLLRLRSPATGVRLLLGNGPSPWQAWFGVANATEEVRAESLHVNKVDGWTVAAGNTMRVNNPTANPITYDVVLLGSP